MNIKIQVLQTRESFFYSLHIYIPVSNKNIEKGKLMIKKGGKKRKKDDSKESRMLPKKITKR